jgi:hypothetical protein
MSLIRTVDLSTRHGRINVPDFGEVMLIKGNSQRGEPLGDYRGVCMHWTAGDRLTAFDEYHLNIADNGRAALIIKTLPLTDKGQHVWGRNTGLVGLSYCAMLNATSNNLGKFQPTARQREAMQVVVAELCAWRRLDPHDTFTLPKMKPAGARLAPAGGSVEVPVVADHAIYAKLDGYPRDRWDTGPFYAEDRAAICKVYDELKAGKRQFRFASLF